MRVEQGTSAPERDCVDDLPRQREPQDNRIAQQVDLRGVPGGERVSSA
jgi:hypothetical protein